MGEEARLIFRKLTTKDANDAAALDLKCFGEKEACDFGFFYHVAWDRRFEFWVAERDEKIIACAGAEVFSDTAEIESLAVDFDYRRRGIGKTLLIKLLEAVRKRGATLAVLEVRPSNTAAIALYKKFGFQIVERAKDYYPDEDAWIMARDFA